MITTRIQLTDVQLDKISDVLISMGTVVFGSAVVPFFLIENFDEQTFYAGLVLTFVCWTASIYVVRRIKK